MRSLQGEGSNGVLLTERRAIPGLRLQPWPGIRVRVGTEQKPTLRRSLWRTHRPHTARSLSFRGNIDLDVVLSVLAGAICSALGRRLPGYQTATPDTLQRRFLQTGGTILKTNDTITVRLDRRAYSPVLRSADLPDTTVPWWGDRRLHLEYAEGGSLSKSGPGRRRRAPRPRGKRGRGGAPRESRSAPTRARADDQVAIGDRVGDDGLLKQPVEQQAAAP